MATYKNPWHKKNTRDCGPAMYETDVRPTQYCGYLIYHRIDGAGPIASGSHCFDIVKLGVCVSQMAGPNGARRKIDELCAV